MNKIMNIFMKNNDVNILDEVKICREKTKNHGSQILSDVKS